MQTSSKHPLQSKTSGPDRRIICGTRYGQGAKACLIKDGYVERSQLARPLLPMTSRDPPIAWALAWPGVTGAIVGACTPKQVDGWVGAASITLTHRFRFDTVQIPLNVMDAHYDSFQWKVLPVLAKNEIGVLGMKPMGSGP